MAYGDAFRTSVVRDYNPDVGPVFVITYEGTHAQIDPIRSNWELLGAGAPTGYGFRTNFSQSPSGVRLTVRIPEGTTFTDRWNLDTEVVPDPLWYSDYTRAYLLQSNGQSWGDLDLSNASNLVSWLYFIARVQRLAGIVKTGTGGSEGTLNQSWAATFPEYTVSPADTYFQKAWDVIFMTVRDGDYVERNRPVLKRCRQIPLGSGDRTTISGKPLVYTTAALIDTYGVPDDVVAQIEDVDLDLPDAPANTRWTWKLRQNNSETLLAWGSGRAVEIRDWVFGRWSTISHTLIE